jgi:hypothetical protein
LKFEVFEVRAYGWQPTYFASNFLSKSSVTLQLGDRLNFEPQTSNFKQSNVESHN